MDLAITSLIAGVLTILAPCVLPLLPVIVGGSVREGDEKTSAWRRPLTITASLTVSVILFTMLIKGTSVLLGVPEDVWKAISGVIIVGFGLIMLFPTIWEQISLKLGFGNASNRLLFKASSKKGTLGDVLIGAALGPVFTSCSPTYGLIIATILPVSLAEGFIYLSLYVIGLAATLLLLAVLGGKAINKLGWATDPNSVFRRTLGALFIVTGLAVATGLDKTFETWLLDLGIYDPISDIEQSLTN